MTDAPDDLVERLTAAAYNFGDSYPTWAALQREAAAEITRLRERVAELERENAAIRTLMNAYNLGGWTDSISVLQRAERAEQELSRARCQLRWRAEDVGATHYPKCWRDHYACAMDEIERITLERDTQRDLTDREAKRSVQAEAERDAYADTAAVLRNDIREMQRNMMSIDTHRERLHERLTATQTELGRMSSERDALRAENEGLRQDAGRYRWVRDISDDAFKAFKSRPDKSIKSSEAYMDAAIRALK